MLFLAEYLKPRDQSYFVENEVVYVETGKNLSPDLIAPCGMNCALCASYLALVNDLKSKGIKISYCTGCRARNKKCAFMKKILFQIT